VFETVERRVEHELVRWQASIDCGVWLGENRLLDTSPHGINKRGNAWTTAVAMIYAPRLCVLTRKGEEGGWEEAISFLSLTGDPLPTCRSDKMTDQPALLAPPHMIAGNFSLPTTAPQYWLGSDMSR
jgi:hypothetical protein